MSIAIYCDESCHLEHDDSNVMGFGAVWTNRASVKLLSLQLRDIKRRHKAAGELKWTKVSTSKLDFYQEVIDRFFESESLHFRSLIAPNKSALNHEKFNQGSHDDFYYKMYLSLLNKILSPTDPNEIYLDIKDTRSRENKDLPGGIDDAILKLARVLARQAAREDHARQQAVSACHDETRGNLREIFHRPAK